MTRARKGTDGWRQGKGQIGIDGNKDVGFSRQHAVDPWDSNPAGNFKSPKGAGKYEEKDADFLRNRLPDEATSRAKDIFDNVERNSGNGAPGPIKYGVD
jgi:hypothetical protein